jgi:hypothetical protein
MKPFARVRDEWCADCRCCPRLSALGPCKPLQCWEHVRHVGAIIGRDSDYPLNQHPLGIRHTVQPLYIDLDLAKEAVDRVIAVGVFAPRFVEFHCLDDAHVKREHVGLARQRLHSHICELWSTPHATPSHSAHLFASSQSMTPTRRSSGRSPLVLRCRFHCRCRSRRCCCPSDRRERSLSCS